MNITFFDDPLEGPQGREDVKLEQLGLYIYPDRRRVAVGFELTPFRERPSLEVTITNARGEKAGSLSVIEALSPNFSLTVHLRDQEPTEQYQIEVVVYYAGSPEDGRQVVYTQSAVFDVSEPGEQIFRGEAEE